MLIVPCVWDVCLETGCDSNYNRLTVMIDGDGIMHYYTITMSSRIAIIYTLVKNAFAENLNDLLLTGVVSAVRIYLEEI